MDKLECVLCGQTFDWNPGLRFCPDCREPLVVAPNAKAGKRRIHEDRDYPLAKYQDFLPLEALEPRLNLGEGNTPLVPLNKLGAELGNRRAFAKNEAQNPTGSFKDRGTAVAVQKALALGFKRIGTVSTGNMAASTAAYGARAAMDTYVLLKEGTSSLSLRAAGIFGPTLVSVEGDYGRLFTRSLELGRDLGIYFMNSVDVFRLEGYKVTGFEIFTQLGHQAPRFLFVPLSSGGHLLGLMRAFEDLEREGLISRYPTFVGVQAAGCAPLVKAFESGREKYERLDAVMTIAHAISNPAPPAGNAVLKKIRDHGGVLIGVSDEEMLGAQRALAEAEGLFCQPESATTMAGWKKLAAKGAIAEDDISVLVLTGSGLKAPHVLESQPFSVHQFLLADLAAGLKGLIR